MSIFKIGDRVVGVTKNTGFETNGVEGTVVDIRETKSISGKGKVEIDIYVDFDKNVGGWDLDGITSNGFGLIVDEYEIKLANEYRTLQVRYIDKTLTKMEKIEKGDLVDLRVSKIFVNGVEGTFPCTYKFGDVVFVKLGFAMKIPQGYKANVYPRSGTFKNYGIILTNSVGQIDNAYQGNDDEWCGMFYATREGTMNYDDRILQFEVVPQAMNNVVFDFVEELGDINRGGYGSTGVK